MCEALARRCQESSAIGQAFLPLTPPLCEVFALSPRSPCFLRCNAIREAFAAYAAYDQPQAISWHNHHITSCHVISEPAFAHHGLTCPSMTQHTTPPHTPTSHMRSWHNMAGPNIAQHNTTKPRSSLRNAAFCGHNTPPPCRRSQLRKSRRGSLQSLGDFSEAGSAGRGGGGAGLGRGFQKSVFKIQEFVIVVNSSDFH